MAFKIQKQDILKIKASADRATTLITLFTWRKLGNGAKLSLDLGFNTYLVSEYIIFVLIYNKSLAN